MCHDPSFPRRGVDITDRSDFIFLRFVQDRVFHNLKLLNYSFHPLSSPVFPFTAPSRIHFMDFIKHTSYIIFWSSFHNPKPLIWPFYCNYTQLRKQTAGSFPNTVNYILQLPRLLTKEINHGSPVFLLFPEFYIHSYHHLQCTSLTSRRLPFHFSRSSVTFPTILQHLLYWA